MPRANSSLAEDCAAYAYAPHAGHDSQTATLPPVFTNSNKLPCYSLNDHIAKQGILFMSFANGSRQFKAGRSYSWTAKGWAVPGGACPNLL